MKLQKMWSKLTPLGKISLFLLTLLFITSTSFVSFPAVSDMLDSLSYTRVSLLDVQSLNLSSNVSFSGNPFFLLGDVLFMSKDSTVIPVDISTSEKEYLFSQNFWSNNSMIRVEGVTHSPENSSLSFVVNASKLTFLRVPSIPLDEMTFLSVRPEDFNDNLNLRLVEFSAVFNTTGYYEPENYFYGFLNETGSFEFISVRVSTEVFNNSLKDSNIYMKSGIPLMYAENFKYLFKGIFLKFSKAENKAFIIALNISTSED